MYRHLLAMAAGVLYKRNKVAGFADKDKLLLIPIRNCGASQILAVLQRYACQQPLPFEPSRGLVNLLAS